MGKLYCKLRSRNTCEKDMNISSLIHKRKSCRAYIDRSVAPEVVRSLLETAKWAPSGVNHQPGKVAVLGSETRKKLSKALIEKFDSGAAPNPDYEYCPTAWSEVYKNRRKACGRALYQSLGVSLDDLEGKKRHKRRNYDFFEAPLGLIIFIEKAMPKGSWLDIGLFIQNFLLAAEGLGLATCAQASFADYPDVVREVLGLTGVDIVCGIAVGYEDPTHSLNSYRTEREPIDGFTHWYNPNLSGIWEAAIESLELIVKPTKWTTQPNAGNAQVVESGINKPAKQLAKSHVSGCPVLQILADIPL